MIKNYFKIAFRNLWKNKLFSTINIISLAIGLSASFVIGLMVYHEFTFDKFHQDAERIYRITTNFRSPSGDFYNSGVPRPLGNKIKEDIPGVEIATSFYTSSPSKIYNPKSGQTFKNPKQVTYADANYFHFFDYHWLAGNKLNPLQEPNQVILTEARANKYFPNMAAQEIVGSTLIYNDSVNVTVTGVVENFQQRSDLIFEEFISVQTAAFTDEKDQVINEEWNSTSSASQLFVKVSEAAGIADLQERLDFIAKEHEGEEAAKYGQHREFYLQPLNDLHFNSSYGIFNSSPSPASKGTLIGLAFIALFLLLLACINFINLNTALATQRSKEIGIRKTLGSSRKQLIFQFLGETLVLTILAAAVSLLLTDWLIREFSEYMPSGIGLHLLKSPVIIISIAVLLLLVTFLSGFYPALVLTHFKPISVIREQVFRENSKSSLRKILTVFQFTIAQVFIIATLLVGKQIHFLMTKDMGFNTQAVAYIMTPWKESSLDKRVRLMEEIKKIPQIKTLSLGGNPPASGSTYSTTIQYLDEENETNLSMELLFGDMEYASLYDIEILAGRKALNDTIKELVVNEAMSKALGFTIPDEAIGKSITYNGNSHPIVGVMEDFNQRSLKSPIKPMALLGDWNRSAHSRFNTIHLSLSGGEKGELPSVISKAEEAWKSIYPEEDFELTFMDETIQKFYKREQSTVKLLNWATGLSILISCLGLLGLVIYTTERRRKEIGIRKVLGASLSQLNLLLCKDFMILVGLAFLIAAPIAWWGLNNWLQEFAYKTSLSWWIFLLSGGAMLCIAFIVMSFRTIRTAMANPVKSLKSE